MASTGISMSFIGFAALFMALRRHDAEWQAYEVGQVNCIVLYGLVTLFGGLLVIPIVDRSGRRVPRGECRSPGDRLLHAPGPSGHIVAQVVKDSELRLTTRTNNQHCAVRMRRCRRPGTPARQRHHTESGAVRARTHHDARHPGARLQVGRM